MIDCEISTSRLSRLTRTQAETADASQTDKQTLHTTPSSSHHSPPADRVPISSLLGRLASLLIAAAAAAH